MNLRATLVPILQLASRRGAKWPKPLRPILLALLVGLSVCATRADAQADITLLSITETPGNYDYLYGITTTQSTTWTPYEYLEFSGISGLNGWGEAGATLEGFGLSGDAVTGTVEFTADTTITLAAGSTYGTLDISSSSPTMGLINYTSTSDPMFSGTVEGPVAATPEPSSILLFTGFLSLIGMALLSKRLALS